LPASAGDIAAPDRDSGAWKTWIIPSGKEFRVPLLNDRGATEKEAVEVSKLAALAVPPGADRSGKF